MAAVCSEEAADTFHDMDLHLVWNGTELEEASSSVVDRNEVDVLGENADNANTLINETATLDNVELDMKVKVNDDDLQAKADYQVYKTDNNITATLTLKDDEECCVDDATVDPNPNALLEACIKVDKVEKTGTNVSMHMEWHTQTAKDVEAMLRFSNNNNQPKSLKNDEKIEAVIKMNDNSNNDSSSHSYIKSKESFSDMILNDKIAPYLNDYVDINIKGKRRKKKSENKYLDMCKRSYVDANKIKKIKIIQYKIKRKQNFDEDNSINLSASIEKIIEADLQTRIPHGTNRILTNPVGDNSSSSPTNSGEDGVDGSNHNLISSDDDSFLFIRSEETKALILNSGNTEEGDMYSGKIFTKEVIASNSSLDKNCNMNVDVEKSVEFQIISVEKYDTKVEELKEDSYEKGVNAGEDEVKTTVDSPMTIEDEDIERNKVIIERVFETQIKSEIHLCESTMSQSVDNDKECNMMDNSFHTTSDEKEKSAEFQIISVEKSEAENEDEKKDSCEENQDVVEEVAITANVADTQVVVNEDEDVERNQVVVEKVLETQAKPEIDICNSTSTNNSVLEISGNKQEKYNAFEENYHTISEEKEKSAEFQIISVEKCNLESKEESSCEINLEEEESVITPILVDVQMAVNEENLESNQVLVQRVFETPAKSGIDICDTKSIDSSMHEISKDEQEQYNTFKEIFHTTSEEKEESADFQIISVEKCLAEVEADEADSCEDNLDLVEENVISPVLIDDQMAINEDGDMERNEVLVQRVFESHEKADIDIGDSFSTNSSIHEVSIEEQQEYNTFEENFHTTSEEKEKSVEFQIISVDAKDLEDKEDVSCELKLQVEEESVITENSVDVQMTLKEDENVERNQILVQRVFEPHEKPEIDICDSTSTVSMNEPQEYNTFEENFHTTSEEKEKSVEFQVISVGECDIEVEGEEEGSYEKQLSEEEEAVITANLVDAQMAVKEENIKRNKVLVQRVFETHDKSEIDFSHSLSESLSLHENENSYQELEGNLNTGLDKESEDEKYDGKEKASLEIKLENAVIDLEGEVDLHASFVETMESFIHLNKEPTDEPTDVVDEVEEDVIVEQIEDDVMCELVNSEIYEHSLFSPLEYHEDLAEEGLSDDHNQPNDHVSCDDKMAELSNSNNDFVHSDIEEIKSIEKNCIEINRYASLDEKDLTISREENNEININMKRDSIRKNLIVIPMSLDDNHVNRNVILVHRLLDTPETCVKDESISESSIQTATEDILDESNEEDGGCIRLGFNNDVIIDNVTIGSEINDYDSSFDSVYDEGEINLITTIHEDILHNCPENSVIDLQHENRNHVEIMRINNEKRSYEEESSIKSSGLSTSIDGINSRNLIVDEHLEGDLAIENIDIQHQGEISIESIDKRHREDVGMTSYITCTYIEYEEYFLKSNETYVMNKDEMEIYDFLEAFKTGFVILNVEDDKPPLEVGYSTIEAKYLNKEAVQVI